MTSNSIIARICLLRQRGRSRKRLNLHDFAQNPERLPSFVRHSPVAMRYLELLSAGGSKPPEELGAIVGIDLADPGFWDKGLDLVENQLTEAEAAAREARPDLRMRVREVRRARRDIRRQLRAETLDGPALEKAFAALRARSASAHGAMHAVIGRIAGTLSVEERRQLDVAEAKELEQAMDEAWAKLPANYHWLKDWEYV